MVSLVLHNFQCAIQKGKFIGKKISADAVGTKLGDRTTPWESYAKYLKPLRIFIYTCENRLLYM